MARSISARTGKRVSWIANLIVRPKLSEFCLNEVPISQISGEHLRHRRVRAAESTRLKDVAGD